ncbi:MAG: S8 family serine peptidase [Candidatus Sericytochromatia bacterium]
MRNKGKIALLVSLLTIFSCQETKMPVATLDKTTKSQSISELKDIFEEKEIKCPNESTFNTKAFTPTTETIKLPIDEQQIVQSQVPAPTFDDVNPLPSTTTKTGHIVLIFKDQYKIRLTVEEEDKHEKNKYKFEAKTDGAEKAVKVINKLIKDNKIVVTSNLPYAEKSQNEKEKIEKEEDEKKKFVEKETEKKTKKKYDFPNRLAIYDLFVPDGNIANITQKLRDLNVTLSANFFGDRTMGTSAITNDSIFNNDSVLSLIATTPLDNLSGSLKISDDNGYHFARINAPKAWELAKQNSVTPAKTAVIESNFASFSIDTPNYASSSSPLANPAVNMFDHGSAVAGIIAMKGNNNFGSVGLLDGSVLGNTNQTQFLFPFRVDASLSSNGFSDSISNSSIANTINIAVNSNIKVINLSMGPQNGTLEDDPEIRMALKNAYDKGTLCVLSAGNDNFEVKYDSNKYTGALIVGATDKFSNERAFNKDNINKFSNYGDRIDISAPGKNIISLNKAGFGLWSGTSFSAPMVTSTAALLKGYNPNLTVDQLKNLIIFSAKLIQTDKQMGPSKKYYDPTPISLSNGGTYNLAVTNPPTIPNGRLLDMGKAMELATKMYTNPLFVQTRTFNVDSHVISSSSANPGMTPINNYFKDDSIMTYIAPYSGQTYSFSSYNRDCVYSYGYQVWKNNIVLGERVAGIAGRLLPANTPNPPKSNSEYLVNDFTFNF